MKLKDKLLIISILIVFLPFSYVGLSFGIEPNTDERELIQIWKINQEDNYTYSLSSIMEHHSNANAIKVMKIFKPHVKRIIDIFSKKLENTDGVYIIVLFANNGTELWEEFSKNVMDPTCGFPTSEYYYDNFTNPNDGGGGGSIGCGGGSGGGS